MEKYNLIAGWFGILVGFLSGAVQGAFFHDESWLGGYGSWPRRLMRLGHISFLGLAFINISYALSASYLGIDGQTRFAGWLFILGAITMPITCYASAFFRPARYFFSIPVTSLIVGAAQFLYCAMTNH